jgi:hypothetical protein
MTQVRNLGFSAPVASFSDHRIMAEEKERR